MHLKLINKGWFAFAISYLSNGLLHSVIADQFYMYKRTAIQRNIIQFTCELLEGRTFCTQFLTFTGLSSKMMGHMDALQIHAKTTR